MPHNELGILNRHQPLKKHRKQAHNHIRQYKSPQRPSEGTPHIVATGDEDCVRHKEERHVEGEYQLANDGIHITLMAYNNEQNHEALRNIVGADATRHLTLALTSPRA